MGIGPAGPPAVVIPKTYYKRYLIDKSMLEKDPHFVNGCSSCHKGDEKSTEQETAHKGVISKPSADLKICGDCHGDITEAYQNASHYTVQEMFNKVSKRFSKKEEAIFTDKVFAQSCKSCHASCGDCHVSSPSKEGVSTGLMRGHSFVKRDEGKTCAVCHGGRVYPEYTGKHNKSPDVHFQRGMACIDCHKKSHIHGGPDGARKNEKMVHNKPKCLDCHKLGKETKVTAKLAHARHEGSVSCYGCHSQGEYNNCYNCHIGKGATSKLGFILGLNPGDKKTLTTLRATPVTRNTFLGAGIKMENFDEVPDYRGTAVHNISRSTERTRSCDTCHVKRKGFLTKESLIKSGSKANESLIFKMLPLNIN
jgi:thiosulfate/3-mercaptopyruvate sulfurtransferase